MASASAIGTLVSLAGAERVAVTVGTGFTGALTLGQRPVRWTFVADYVRALRGLLRGEQVEWNGAPIRMMQYPDFGPPRPIEIPILVGAAGPKGTAVARELGDGVFGAMRPVPGFDWSAVLTCDTVLDEGEHPDSERVLAAAGHAAGVTMHYAVEFGGVDRLPNGHMASGLVSEK
jgi:5,10-methylenetetrahydromethanopterin reductase